MRKLILFLSTMFVLTSASAQQDNSASSAVSEFTPYYKYRVTLTSKGKSEYSVNHPEQFLSQKALDRRQRQKIKVDESDLPISQEYIKGIADKGVKVLLTSKWNCTVLVQCEDTTLMAAVNALPYVQSVRKVATYTKPQPPSDVKRRSLITGKSNNVDTGSPYGNAHHQIEMLNGIALHEKGYKGDGMTIAVVDAGFYNADCVPGLAYTKILGTRDFVDPNSDIYGESSHGMMVLSCMGANTEYEQIGTAPEASYWLLRSEDANTEQLVEEDYWAAAVEFADSVGADVVNTSLGYTKFDNPVDNVLYSEQDGKTHLISRSASRLASKGMILCCSAGNEGDSQWKRIGVPADAEYVLAVGACDPEGANTNFSSLGYSADGRVKPDVMAQGGSSAVYGITGVPRTANGTSFSSPILCGMVACLWQALPQLNSYELMEIVRRSGNRYETPDNVYGYGIPDFIKAYNLGVGMK